MGRRKTLDKKILKLYSAVFLAVFIIATFSGCTEDLEEPQDTVNIYVYEEMGQQGDPQEEIDKFFDVALKGDNVEITPLQKYAVEFDIDPDTGELNIDTTKIYI